MSKINTKTSVHLMQMNDRGMQKFGVKELLKNYDENIIDMIEKATTAPFNSLPEVMEALEAYKAVYPEVDQIMQGIQEVVKKKKANEAESDYKLPIEEIMDLFIVFAFEERRERLVPSAAEPDHLSASRIASRSAPSVSAGRLPSRRR